MKKVVVLTGDEMRHRFARKALALSPDIEVLGTYCEGVEQGLSRQIDPNEPEAEVKIAHVEARTRSEEDFFGNFVALAPDRSNPMFIPKGAINQARHVQELIDLAPELLVSYGPSLIKGRLVDFFQGRFLNVHLGISPEYRGAGCNFWALVNGEPEYVGATFMFIDRGIDSGEIIHQIRARVFPGDSPHQIGNRLIGDMIGCYARLIADFDRVVRLPQPSVPDTAKLYLKGDFTVEAVRKLYANFQDGLVERYLKEKDARTERAPLRCQSWLLDEGAGWPTPEGDGS